ncbi:MAG: citrate lyase subunit beta/citryl-CoA lyase [Limisphaerales bacterium]|jgi:citrate lyase subunit beta/citryl-CoA lyase
MDRLRRSCHFVPGANEKMLHKSLATAADSLILDLEDAVAPDRKEAARQTVAEWLRDVDFGRHERTVRMNPLDSPWGLDDLRVTMEFAPDAYVVPKVSTLEELTTISSEITKWEHQYGHPQGSVALILICTETPLSALNIATFPQCERVTALSWGAEDLSAALGAPRNRRPDGSYLDIYTHCRNMTLLSAAAGGVQPIDTVYVDFNDSEGLKRECQEAAWMGFTGKITIHPNQIDIVNSYFTPSIEEVDEAQRLVAAFDEAQRQGLMAISFEGKMVDVPHLTRAKKLLQRAEEINQRMGTV